LIDTSVFVAMERSGVSLVSTLEPYRVESIALAAVTASELLHGVHRADSAVRRGRREAFVEAILRAVPVLAFDLEVARVHARVWADLRTRHSAIGAHDAMIAATALTHEMKVLTGNVREFERVDGLEVVRFSA